MANINCAIVETATGAVVNVGVFDVPEGGTLQSVADGKYVIRDAGAAIVAEYDAGAGRELYDVTGVSVSPGDLRQQDGTFMTPMVA